MQAAHRAKTEAQTRWAQIESLCGFSITGILQPQNGLLSNITANTYIFSLLVTRPYFSCTNPSVCRQTTECTKGHRQRCGNANGRTYE